MAEKKCSHCASVIPQEAKICPHCRKKLGWTLPAKIFLVLIIIGVIGSFMAKNRQPTPDKIPAQKAVISITAEQLYKEYEDNEIAADMKYKNKLLQITGTIRVIRKTFGDAPHLNLATGHFSHQVMITFPSEKYDKQLAEFNRGDSIVITGTCGGLILGMIAIDVE